MTKRFLLLSVALLAFFAVRGQERPRQFYGKNIFSFAPIQMTNESGVGIGLQYERFLDARNIFSFYLPVAFSFYDDKAMDPTKRTFTYLYPGVKIYPGGSNRRLAYSLAPTIAIGFGKRYLWDHRPLMSTSSKYVEDQLVKTGFMINNGLNIQATPNLYVGLELGLGILYYASSEAYWKGDESEPLVQFQFKMGYRF